MCDKLKKIEMGKKYTYLGKPARVLCVDKRYRLYPVIALITDNSCETVTSFTADGRSYEDAPADTTHRLIEVSPYADWKIDDKILVTNNLTGDTRWYKRHFAGLGKDGQPTAFADGKTSWSDAGQPGTAWNFAKKPEAQE